MRPEFSKQTKREAHDRSGGLCEAVGEMYNLPPGKRCNLPLGKGVQYDHILACSNGGDNSLSNCAAICIPCHAFKTAKIDIPRAAKTVRMRDNHLGINRQTLGVRKAFQSKFKRKISGEVVLR